MNTTQLNNFLKNCDDFLGTFPLDKIPKTTKNTFGFILNTDPSYKPGEHWVAIYVKNRKGVYFDSFGLPPLLPEIVTFFEKHCLRWSFNQIPFQSVTSSNCGKYALLYLFLKLNNYNDDDFKFLFTANVDVNETIINKQVDFFPF